MRGEGTTRAEFRFHIYIPLLSFFFFPRTQEASSVASQGNPLLKKFELPLFDEIEAEHVVPGMTQLLEGLNEELDKLEDQVTPSWSGRGLAIPLLARAT